MLDKLRPNKTIGPGSKSTQAAKPAHAVHKKAVGRVTKRHLFVLTGWTNSTGRNIDKVRATTMPKIIQKFGSRAKKTRITIFQQPGNPEKELSLVFIRVSTK